MPWPDVFARNLELVERAEQGGLGSVWFTEHHLFADGYLPQPLTFLAAVAARTRTITIGTAVLLAALRPARWSPRRPQWSTRSPTGASSSGIGAGYRPRVRALRQGPLEALRAHRRPGGRDPAPARRRRGHPAARPAALPDLARLPGPAGRPPGRPARRGPAQPRPAPARALPRGPREGGHDPASARTGGMLDIVVADDPEATLARILPHLLHQANTYAECAVAGTGVEPRVLTAEKAMSRSTAPGQVPGLRVLTPDDARGRHPRGHRGRTGRARLPVGQRGRHARRRRRPPHRAALHPGRTGRLRRLTPSARCGPSPRGPRIDARPVRDRATRWPRPLAPATLNSTPNSVRSGTKVPRSRRSVICTVVKNSPSAHREGIPDGLHASTART